MNPLIDIILAGLVMLMAFAMGFAIRRGSICMVAASQMLVVEGRPKRLRSFALAGAVAALAIIPISWIAGNPQMLAPDYGISAGLLLSGCGFGMGAMINGGCAFGTLSRLSGGQIEYAASIAATVAGALMAATMHQIPPESAGMFAEPGLAGIAMLAISAMLVWPELNRKNWNNFKSVFNRDKTLLRPTTAMLLIGLLSGLLFALAGSWSHLAVLNQETQILAGQRPEVQNLKAIAAAAALVSGAVFAAIRSGRFKLEMPTLAGLLRRTIGGGLMGYCAASIPGGNGALLTYGLPSGSVSAWAGFAAMTLTLIMLFVPIRIAKQRAAAKAKTGK